MFTRLLRLVGSAVLPASLLIAPAAVPVSAGGGCHGDLGNVHNDAATSVVRMDVCTFEPTVARVAVGTEVRFLNTATVVHVVTGERQSWGSGGEIAQGAEVRQRFDTPGVFPYSCPLHPGMVGAIVVGEAGSAAVAPAGGDGSGDGATGGPAAATVEVVAPVALVILGMAGLAGAAWLAGRAVSRRRVAG